MKLSIITTVTDPDKRQDAWREALDNYCDLADEVILVNGGERLDVSKWNKVKQVMWEWPYDWSWEEFPKHYNLGLSQASGDWVISMDIDRFIHENDFKALRIRLEDIDNKNGMVASLMKMNVYCHKKYGCKGGVNACINKKKYPDVMFGKNIQRVTDLCDPIIFIGSLSDKGVPEGIGIPRPLLMNTGIDCWNFSYTFKTKEVAKDNFYRQSIAYKRYFGKTKWGETPDEAFNVMVRSNSETVKRLEKKFYDLRVLPKYIRDKYAQVTVEQFGHSGWGII